MPSETKKQSGAMAVCCHNPKACRAGIPRKVACEFNRADMSIWHNKSKTAEKKRGRRGSHG